MAARTLPNDLFREIRAEALPLKSVDVSHWDRLSTEGLSYYTGQMLIIIRTPRPQYGRPIGVRTLSFCAIGKVENRHAHITYDQGTWGNSAGRRGHST